MAVVAAAVAAVLAVEKLSMGALKQMAVPVAHPVLMVPLEPQQLEQQQMETQVSAVVAVVAAVFLLLPVAMVALVAVVQPATLDI